MDLVLEILDAALQQMARLKAGHGEILLRMLGRILGGIGALAGSPGVVERPDDQSGVVPKRRTVASGSMLVAMISP